MDSIIFDLDGTLWDATENICHSWNEVLREHYPDIPQLKREELFAQMGKLLDDIGRSLFPQAGSEERIHEIVTRCCEYENEYLAIHGGVLYDGLRDTLHALRKRCRLFIVSNCQCGYIEAFLKSQNLADCFEDYECGGNTGLTKAENIRLVVERNALISPIYVGDTELDRTSSIDAGVPFVWAAYGFGEPQGSCARIDNPCELLKLDFTQQ